MESGKRQIKEGIELPNQKRIRTLGEAENYKKLGILEAEKSKNWQRKEKNKEKSISDE